MKAFDIEFYTGNKDDLVADIVEAIPGLADEELSGSVLIKSESDSGCKVLSVRASTWPTTGASPAATASRSARSISGET